MPIGTMTVLVDGTVPVAADFNGNFNTLNTTTIPVGSGGTGLTAGTSGGIPGYTAAATLASSAALTANGVVLGGGAGATPLTRTGFTFDGTSVTITPVGPHATGVATTANRQFSLGGTFAPTGPDVYGLFLSQTFTVGVNGESIGLVVNPTFTEAASGVHATLAAMSIGPTFTNAAATATDVIGARFSTFAAPAGTTNATALKLDAPTGATNNYTLWVATGNMRMPDARSIGWIANSDQGPGIYGDTTQLIIRSGTTGVLFNNQLSDTTLMRLLNGGHLLLNTTTDSAQLSVVSSGAAVIGLYVNTAASPTAFAQEWRNNGTAVAELSATITGVPYFSFTGVNLGNNIAGPRLGTGRNTNAGAEGPTAGTVGYLRASGALNVTWTDASDQLRINTAAPTGSSGTPTVSDTAGTVVGTQTSWYEMKHVAGLSRIDPTEALRTLLATQIYDFRYVNHAYNDRQFTGPVGYTREDWFLKNTGPQQIPALDEITVHGYTILAIQALHARLAVVEQS